MSLYTATQRLLRFGFWLYYKKVHVQQLAHFPTEGPVLLVANHPNSFMDALVIGAYLPRPTHFLARGDAFNNPVLANIFHAYHMLPVYRASEGKENIEKNFETFDVSYDVVNRGEVMLIFGEGLCKNNWDLRPLKKGPARIAQRAWKSDGIARNMVVLPVGLTYEHFSGGGKSLVVRYGEPIRRAEMESHLAVAGFTQELNHRIREQLLALAYVNPSLPEGDKDFVLAWEKAESQHQDILAALPPQPATGVRKRKRWLTPLHYGIIAWPHYAFTMAIARRLTKGSVFYDSIGFGLMLFLFPLYWLTLLVLILYAV